ncbi:hypothetical protein Tco_1450921, partial [Tanacetum coccineum]
MSSNEASFGVTYTSISSDYEEPSDSRHHSRRITYRDHPKYLDPSDEKVPVEDQPYAAVDSPIALSSGYITDSDPKKDPEDESEDGPMDYPADGGDDDDDDDDDSSGDDADDEDEGEASEEDEEEEEEKHLALTDSTAAASPIVGPVPFAEETELFDTDESAATPPPPPAYQVDRLLAIPTPSPSSLTPLSSPLPQIPLPPFPVPSPPTTSSTYTEAPLGYRAAGIRLRTASPPPLPLSSPLPLLPPIILPRTKASMILMRAAAPSTYILAPRSGTLPSGTPPSGT